MYAFVLLERWPGMVKHGGSGVFSGLDPKYAVLVLPLQLVLIRTTEILLTYLHVRLHQF